MAKKKVQDLKNNRPKMEFAVVEFTAESFGKAQIKKGAKHEFDLPTATDLIIRGVAKPANDASKKLLEAAMKVRAEIVAEEKKADK